MKSFRNDEMKDIVGIFLKTNICLSEKGLFYSDYNLGNIHWDEKTSTITFLDYGSILPFVVKREGGGLDWPTNISYNRNLKKNPPLYINISYVTIHVQ